MILARGPIQLEFFPHPQLDPTSNWFSCCLRLDDPILFYEVCRAAGVPERAGIPRLALREDAGVGNVVGTLIDPNGSLLRLIRN